MDPLQRMRQVIREQRYRISAHVNDEMADDDLIATDGRRACVVCCFLLSETLLVITAYV
jgi:hypothetical protein